MFNWNKVQEFNVQGTVWEGIQDDSLIEQLDMGEIESLFAAKPAAKPKPKPASAQSSRGGRSGTVSSIIDAKRSTNVGIQLHRLNLADDMVCKAVWQLDSSVLTAEKVTALLNCLPTDDELSTIDKFLESTQTDPDKLPRVEKFFKQIGEVPHIQLRLECYQTSLETMDTIQEVQDDFNILLAAKEEVCESVDFKKILCVVLAIGNALNAGGRQGQAAGFQLSSLTKLKETKMTAVQDRSLLHFVAEKLEQLAAGCEIDLLSVMPSLEDASKVHLEEVTKRLKVVRAQVEKCKRSVGDIRRKSEQQGPTPTIAAPRMTTKSAALVDYNQTHNKPEPRRKSSSRKGSAEAQGDAFHAIMGEFVEQAGSRLAVVEKLSEEVHETLRDFAVSFGESQSQGKPEDLFVIVAAFAKDLQQAHRQNRARQKVEEKKASQVTSAAASAARPPAKRKLRRPRLPSILTPRSRSRQQITVPQPEANVISSRGSKSELSPAAKEGKGNRRASVVPDVDLSDPEDSHSDTSLTSDDDDDERIEAFRKQSQKAGVPQIRGLGLAQQMVDVNDDVNNAVLKTFRETKVDSLDIAQMIQIMTPRATAAASTSTSLVV